MDGLTWLLQVALVALAFGCGIPALIYLAFKGNLREDKDFTAMKKREVKGEAVEDEIVEGFPEPPFTAMKIKRETDEDIEKLTELEKPGWERIYEQVAIKGFVYIPKPVLRRLVREILEEQRAIEEAKAKGDAEKPVKPSSDKLQVRRG